MNKEQDLKMIKQFSKITISAICKDLKIDRANLIKGKASEEATRLVKEELVKRLTTLIKE